MNVSEELFQLRKEQWKYFNIVKEINAIAASRELSEDEQEKLNFYIKQLKSITREIEELQE